MIYGICMDYQGRCQHYHTDLDIALMKCGKCREYFACYQCHNQLQKHSFVPISVNDTAPVCCGNCRCFLTFVEYQKGFCPHCYHAFNPKCQLHKTIYFFEE